MAKLATPLQVHLDYGTRDYERERQGSRFGLRVAAVLCGMNILTMALALLRAFAGQIEMEMFFGFAALLLFPTGIIAALVGLALHFTSNKAARMSGLAALFVLTLFFDGGLLLMIIIQAR